MRIIAVDDESLAVDSLLRLLRQLTPAAELHGFTEAEDAFAFMEKTPVDIAFLDIEMGELNGIALAKQCTDLCPQINIIFVTGYSDYLMDAFELHASGYLMKPVRAASLRKELEHLRHPLSQEKRVRIQTFGNFEVFVDGKPLPIPIAKCKECLAYLIDRRGASVTTAELAGVLWEDAPKDRRLLNNTYRVMIDLIKLLEKMGIAEIVIKTRKNIAVNTDMLDCDYYRFLSGDVFGINTFHGEYMTNYSWAEFTLARLANTKG